MIQVTPLPVEPFNEASTLSLSTLAVPQILYSTEPGLTSDLDRESGTVVQGGLRQLSILYLESEISHQSGKEACIHSTPQSRIVLRKESRSYKKVRIQVDESAFLMCCFRTPLFDLSFRHATTKTQAYFGVIGHFRYFLQKKNSTLVKSHFENRMGNPFFLTQFFKNKTLHSFIFEQFLYMT